MFGDRPSIADLSLACELTQMDGVGFPFKEKYPSIDEWLHGHMMSIDGWRQVYLKGYKIISMLADTVKSI